MADDAGQVHHFDQMRSMLRDEARAIAAFYNSLIEEGVDETLAQRLTVDRHELMTAVSFADYQLQAHDEVYLYEHDDEDD